MKLSLGKRTHSCIVSILIRNNDVDVNLVNIYPPTNVAERKIFFDSLHVFLIPSAAIIIGCNNILDLVLTTNSDLINNLEVSELFSDHNSITFIVNTGPYQQRISMKENYAFNKADWSHIRSLFSYSPWYLTLEQQDINVNWEVWKDLYFTVVNESIPNYRHKRKNIAPWITKDLIKLSRKNTFTKKLKKSNTEDHWVTYCTWNNTLKKKCNLAKWSHLKALADKLQVENNSKPFWNYMRSIRKGTNDLVFLKEGSAEIAGDQEIAQHMNAYFASVFTHEQRTLSEFDYVLNEKWKTSEKPKHTQVSRS